MRNKELALKKLEQVKGTITNIKSSAYRKEVDQLESKFEKLNNLLEDLENLISIEQETLLTRRYNGI